MKKLKKMPPYIVACTKMQYKANGLLAAIKTFFDISLIEIFRWFYRHCGWFRRLAQKRAKKQGEMNLILLELLMAKEPIDVDYWCDRISKANHNSGTNIK